MADQTPAANDLQQKYRQFLDLLHLRLVSPVCRPVKAGSSAKSRSRPVGSRLRPRSGSLGRLQGIAWADRKTVTGRVCRRTRFSLPVLFEGKENPIRQSRDEQGRAACSIRRLRSIRP